MESSTPDGPMSKPMGFWTSRRMVIIACVALTGIVLHLVLRYGMHSEAPSYQDPAVDRTGIWRDSSPLRTAGKGGETPGRF